MDDFNLALQEAELFEAQSNGLTYSWWNNQEENPVAKKIDHAFFNHHWAQKFSDAYCEFLEPDQSDHAPCLVKMPSQTRRVAKPFKFFHHIIDHPDYLDTVKEGWKFEDIQGSVQFKLARSFKLLKPALRRLNVTHFSGISQRVKEQTSKVALIQRQILSNPDAETARLEHEERGKLLLLSKAEEKFYRQKSRVQWLHLGDRDTTFYHKTVVQRANKNHIHFLRDSDDRMISSNEGIKEHSAEYFKGILGSTQLLQSPATVEELRNLMPFRCSEEQKAELMKEITSEEITKTVFAMPLSKSPGPDGYSVEFLRSSWSIVGNDFVMAIREFFRNGRLLKELNSTAIVLIPKSAQACKLGEFRPISCCNIAYKVIAKIIANRLKPILQYCISPNQSAFLKGRSLGENVLLSSELIRNYEKASCAKSSMLKVDIRKAFDTICWDFLLKLLEAQDFPPLFREWIKECITSPRFSMAINGELAGFFRGQNGLRQGDCISPYLFIMVMEVLSNLLGKATLEGRIKLHPNCEDPWVTHLLFADDLLVFSDGSRTSMAGISSVMLEFKIMSGLEMNPLKSEVFFGGYNDIEAAVISNLSGFKQGKFPTRYLGLPLNPGRLTLATMQPFLEKITSKLHSWTVKYLSFAGKIRLVASVIYGMVNFWSAVFVLPKAFYAKVDSLCAAFLWRNGSLSARGARVAWKDICKPKAEGGLGIRHLEEFETVFRLKRIWTFFSASGSIWVAWLKNHIFQRKGFWLISDSARFSSTVRSMLQLRPIISNYMRCVIGDGEAATFWFDSWTNLGPLLDVAGPQGPRQLRVRKNASVMDATNNGSWRLPAARSHEIQTIQIAITSVRPPDQANGPDVFQWRKSDDSYGNSFSSKLTWNFMRIPSPRVFWHKVIWFKENIPRNSFVAWLALLRRLPTKDRLQRWGLNVTGECVLCSSALETHHHLFFECNYSSALWTGFASQIWPNPPSDLHSAAAWISSTRHQTNYNEVTLVKLMFQSIIYLVWKERNARIFTPVSSPSTALHLALDRLLRDRLLSFPATSPTATSLLEFYFSTYRPP